MKQETSPSLALVMVVYHEERCLERCLQSIPDWITERLVVHDGPCLDKSLEIAQKYGCKTVERERCGIAEPHRAWAYQQIRSDWILQLDADEFLRPELSNDLARLILDTSVGVYSFIWPYWNTKKYITKDWPRKKALFCKKKISFLGFPQEEVRLLYGSLNESSHILDHKPDYDNFTWKRFVSKGMPWMKVHGRYYTFSPTELQTFPAGRSLLPHYSIISRHPLLAAFFIPLYHALGILLSGGLKNGFIGLKISFFSSLYYFVVCWFAFFFSRHKNNQPSPK